MALNPMAKKNKRKCASSWYLVGCAANVVVLQHDVKINMFIYLCCSSNLLNAVKQDGTTRQLDKHVHSSIVPLGMCKLKMQTCMCRFNSKIPLLSFAWKFNAIHTLVNLKGIQ